MVKQISEDKAVKPKRGWVFKTVVFLAVYISTYSAMSVFGEYEITMTGENRYVGGLAMMDCYKWQPALLDFEVYYDISGRAAIREMNFLGIIYSPLIVFDRATLHRTRYIIDAGDGI